MQILIGGHVLGFFAGQLPDVGGHLFLAFSSDGITNDPDRIIRGGPVGNALFGNWGFNTTDSIETQINISLDNSYEHPDAWTGSYEQFQPAISLDLASFNPAPIYASAVWQTMVSVASQIGASKLNYDLLDQNSNSVIGTLLSVIGFGPAQSSFTTPGGDNGWYPAVEQPLTSDWLYGGNVSYQIRGGYFTTLLGKEIPIHDRLYALNASDYALQSYDKRQGDHLSGFGGDDELHDGNRQDTLEGGAGDDTYILSNDNARDIIIVGEGNDTIRGGDANDRIVIRIATLDFDYRAYADYFDDDGRPYIDSSTPTPEERLGELAATSAIPLLGGFGNIAEGVDYWDYSQGDLNFLQSGFYTGWDDLYYEAGKNPLYGELKSDFVQGIFNFHYYQDGTSLNVIITFAEFDETTLSKTLREVRVKIENFEEGDFGIKFYEPSRYYTPGRWTDANEDKEPEWTEGYWVYEPINNEDHLNYISNNGDYITVPVAIDPATPIVVNNPGQPPVTMGTLGDDELRGTLANNFVRGLSGNDDIRTFAGDDRVDAGEGNDSVYLGLGADLALGGLGLDQLFGGEGDDGMSGGEDADTLSGGIGNDRLFGDEGDDTLNGGEGDDQLNGGFGNDQLSGGLGNDLFFGHEGDDTLYAGEGDDTLNGGNGKDQLTGGLGNDQLSGDQGNDTLRGGEGLDALNGGDGVDTLFGGLDSDTLNGDDAEDVLHGQVGDDVLNGGAHDDQLFGEGGADQLDGGIGDDVLTGGGAADRFMFAHDGGDDVITDFAAVDFIVFNSQLVSTFSSVMAHATQVGSDVVFTFSFDSLTLENKLLSALNAADFEFI